MRGEAECGDDLAGDGPHWDGDRMQALGKLLVVDGEAFLLYLLELYTQRVLAGDRVRAALCQLDRGEQLALLSLGEVREQHLTHRGAVGGQARSHVKAQIDLALLGPEARRPVDVHDLPAVEHGDTHGVGGLPPRP